MPAPSALWSIGRALRHRNYRLFFAGQSVSLVGTWLTRIATSWLVYRLTGSGLGRVTAFAAGGFGLALIAFSRSTALWLSLPLVMLAGMAMMIQMAASNTILQTIVDEDKRGRVMSFYAMAFFGTVPLGSLFAGTLADRIGAPNTLMIGRVGCVIGALLFLRALPEIRGLVRPIYVRLGVLPEITPAMPMAAQVAGQTEE